MIWGGLRPIRRQLVVDVVVILTATMVGVYCCCCHHDDSGGLSSSSSSSSRLTMIVAPVVGMFPLALSWLLVYVTCGGVMTKRWPLAFGLGALLLLHLLRWLVVVLFVAPAAVVVVVSNRGWSSGGGRVGAILFSTLHLILTLIMTGLVILFPAVELPVDDGPYAVGVYDCFIPITVQVPKTKKNNDDGDETTNVVVEQQQRDMAVRIYHPVARRRQTTALRQRPPRRYYKDYLNPQIGTAFCRHAILAAPPFLRRLDILLHHWRLPRNVAVYIHDDDDIIDNNNDEDDDDNKAATIMAKIKKMMNHNNNDQDINDGLNHNNNNNNNNVIFYSHGLGGCYDVYSYQPRYLVSHGGCTVVAVTHIDGSAAVAPHRNGIDVIPHDYDVDYSKMDEVSYVRQRRRQTNVRIQELTQAAAWYQRQLVSSSFGESSRIGAVQNSQQQGTPKQQQQRPDQKFIFMGHSFGATTVLGVLARHPDLVRAVVAHEPPTDWLPNDVRQRFFYGRNDYAGGTGGYDDDDVDDPSNNNKEIIHQSLHDEGTPILLLHSEEWAQKGFGSIPIIRDMHQQFGQKNRRFHHHHQHFVIADSCHMEFSDTCLMTPVWLGRAVGITNPRRSPCETAREIAAMSWRFIRNTTTVVIDDDENVDDGRGSNGTSNGNGNSNDSHEKKAQ